MQVKINTELLAQIKRLTSKILVLIDDIEANPVLDAEVDNEAFEGKSITHSRLHEHCKLLEKLARANSDAMEAITESEIDEL